MSFPSIVIVLAIMFDRGAVEAADFFVMIDRGTRMGMIGLSVEMHLTERGTLVQLP